MAVFSNARISRIKVTVGRVIACIMHNGGIILL